MTDAGERRSGAQIKQQSSSLAGSIADSVSSEVKDFREETLGRAHRVGTQVKTAANNVQDSAADLLETAKGVAADTGDRIVGAVVTQKDAGANRITNVASVIRRAANDLEKDVPLAAPYIRRAAEEIDDFANTLKTRSLSEIVGSIEGFAQRQPAAFLGIAALAGFVAVRLRIRCQLLCLVCRFAMGVRQGHSRTYWRRWQTAVFQDRPGKTHFGRAEDHAGCACYV